MKRIKELINEIKKRYPKDQFFKEFDTSCKNCSGKKEHYKSYNATLMTLDEPSWMVLKDKAINHYMDHRNGQMKQGFFNQLNEAFAYEYLKNKGFDHVEMIKESKEKDPDIIYRDKSVVKYCEVKSLGISDTEITERDSGSVGDGTKYTRLDDGFFNKVSTAISKSNEQIPKDQDGIVYLIIKFDDSALDYIKEYIQQLKNYFKFNKSKAEIIEEILRLKNLDILEIVIQNQ